MITVVAGGAAVAFSTAVAHGDAVVVAAGGDTMAIDTDVLQVALLLLL